MLLLVVGLNEYIFEFEYLKSLDLIVKVRVFKYLRCLM